MQRYDIIIVGGGLVGAGLAVALRHSGLRMALVDARLPSSNDPRLIALNAGSCQFLENLLLWPRLAQRHRHSKVHVSNQGHFGRCASVAKMPMCPRLDTSSLRILLSQY